jgi:hypothetical protein
MCMTNVFAPVKMDRISASQCNAVAAGPFSNSHASGSRPPASAKHYKSTDRKQFLERRKKGEEYKSADIMHAEHTFSAYGGGGAACVLFFIHVRVNYHYVGLSCAKLGYIGTASCYFGHTGIICFSESSNVGPG